MRPQNPGHKPTTGHATFDREMEAVYDGNATTDTQHSAYIRAHGNTTRPLGDSCEPGVLQDFDLKPFRQALGLPRHIDAAVVRELRDRQGILYAFFHHRGGERVVHGFLLASGDGLNERLGVWATGPTGKSRDIMNAMADWLTYEPGVGDRIDTAVESLAERLAGIEDAEVARAVAGLIGIAAEAEETQRRWGGWRLLAKDADDLESSEAWMPNMRPFAEPLGALRAEGRKAYHAALGLIREGLDAVHAEALGAGAHVDSVTAMETVRRLTQAYQAPAPTPGL